MKEVMSMNSKLNFILGGLIFFVALIIFEGSSGAQMLPAKIIVKFEDTPLLLPKAWSLVEKMNEKEDLLKELPLNVSTKSLDFYENRITRSGDKISTSRKKITEQNKDIGMKIMNIDTGEIRIIKIAIQIQKDGIKLISPPGYQIDIVERASGIRWNRWNTLYKISSPTGWLVLKNKYPDVNEKTQKVTVKDKAGKKRTINKKFYTTEEFIYSPYSGELHTPELIEAGRDYLKLVVRAAMTDLKEYRVPSRAVADQMIADIPSLSPYFFARLPILEHTDMTEFVEDSQKSVERVLVLIGANKGVAFSKTGSKAGAFGWVQFTPTTYRNIRKAYPAAKLIEDFEVGAADHLNSMKAAMLLYDYNLQLLIDKKGKNILSDPRLEEYLAASYNGNPKWVLQSLKASIFGSLDWPTKLKSETKGYLYKIRFLQEKNWP